MIVVGRSVGCEVNSQVLELVPMFFWGMWTRDGFLSRSPGVERTVLAGVTCSVRN